MTSLPSTVKPPAPVAPRRARRSLLLAATGALAGLLIAGFGLFTANGTRTAAVPPEDAAVVNGVPILMADYVTQLRALYDRSLANTTPRERRRALDDMIREELYVQRGVELGQANDDSDVRTALVRSTEGQVAADARATEPSEQEMRDWYRTHPDRYASEGIMRLVDYRVPPDRAREAAAVAAQLRAQRDPAALPLVASGTFDDGEQYYFVVQIRLGEAALARLRALDAGGVSAPFRRADGVHVVRVLENRRPVPDSFDISRPKIIEDWTNDKVKRLTEANDRFLRQRADIHIAGDLQ